MMMQLTRTTGWALAMSVLVLGSVGAQERRPSVPAAAREAQAVLVAANSELATRRITWHVAPTATGLELEAREALSAADVLAAPTLVAATVTVDGQGRLAALAARGTLIDAARQKGAGGREAETDLTAAGARFPPGDAAAVDALVPPGVRAVLGARLVRETMFQAEGTAEAPQDARTWRVELETDDPTGRPYTLVFEPVEGRLLSVVRR